MSLMESYVLTLKIEFSKINKLIWSERFRYVLPYLFWLGTSITYWQSLLVPIMDLQQEEDGFDNRTTYTNCLYALSMVGLGECISGFMIGKIIDSVG